MSKHFHDNELAGTLARICVPLGFVLWVIWMLAT